MKKMESKNKRPQDVLNCDFPAQSKDFQNDRAMQNPSETMTNCSPISAKQTQPTPATPLIQATSVAVDILIRLPAVLQIIPISRSTFYKGIKEGAYPEPRKIGQRISVWRLSTINSLANSLAS